MKIKKSIAEKQVSKKVIDIGPEIELRALIQGHFDDLVEALEGRKNDDEGLVLILSEVIEMRKDLEKKEASLKKQVRELFTARSAVIDLPTVLVMLSQEKRSFLDRESLEREFGVQVIEKFVKITEYERMLVKRKV